ncbi:MAG TPA: hypothetical protein VF541_14140, partial [Longimicrobium sp.]
TTGPPADVAGLWALVWDAASGPRESGSLLLRQEGEKVRAELRGRGSLDAEGTVRGHRLRITGTRLLTRYEIVAAVQGDTMRGTLDVLTIHRAFTGVRRR